MQRNVSDENNQGEMPTSSAMGTRPTKLKSKIKQSSPLQRHMKKNYAEHFRRVVSWRRAARWALFTYPFFMGLAFAVPFVGLHFLGRYLYRIQPEWFTNVLSPDTETFVLSSVTAFGGVAIVLGILSGVGLGISRARLLTFEAEKIEMNVRQSYFLQRISRSLHPLRRH